MGRHQYLRKTVMAVGDRASEILTASRASSNVIRIAVDNFVSPVQNFAQQRLGALGDSLLDSVDSRIDSVVAAVQAVSLEERPVLVQESLEGNQLLERSSDSEESLTNSRWFRRVDSILGDTRVLGSIARPAELFYCNAVHSYAVSQNFGEFMARLRHSFGEAWDERLHHPAAVFFATARAAGALVGAGQALSGAIRSTMSRTIDNVVYGWERVLGASDSAVDYLLPELETVLHPSLDIESRIDVDDEGDVKIFEFEPHLSPQFDPVDHISDLSEREEESDGENETDSSSSRRKKRTRSVAGLAAKVTRRVRQRMPSWETLGTHVKYRLQRNFWFQKVDEILLQNVILRSFGNVLRPAEHFFQTAWSTFSETRESFEEFLAALRQRLGSAWDDRLVASAQEFYESATEASESELSDVEASLRHRTRRF